MAPSQPERVLLTGANRGIGHQMLTALVGDGYRVAALDVDTENIRAVKDSHPDQVRIYECDVSNSEAVTAVTTDVIDRWGRIDILVNNAAVANFAPFDRQTISDTQREFEVNVFGYLHLIHAVLPHMRARDGGIIHNVGSPTGDVGHPGLSGYAATKGAISALTRSLRLELRRTNVSCTLMLPPTTNTRMAAELGYPDWMTADVEDVGHKLADRIDSTAPVITPDRQTSLVLSLIRWFPPLWQMMTERFVDLEK